MRRLVTLHPRRPIQMSLQTVQSRKRARNPFISADQYRYICKQCGSRWDGSWPFHPYKPIQVYSLAQEFCSNWLFSEYEVYRYISAVELIYCSHKHSDCRLLTAGLTSSNIMVRHRGKPFKCYVKRVVRQKIWQNLKPERQTMQILMRLLAISHLIRIYIVCRAIFSVCSSERVKENI